MITHVDWISFSVPMPASGHTDERETVFELWHELEKLCAGLTAMLGLSPLPLPGKGRAPYRHSWTFPASGVTLFTHPNLNHALVEISGRGCQSLIASNLINDVITVARNRVTRLDVACDMLCATSPKDFVSQRKEGRFKAHSEVFSQSGETCYVGSSTSQKYARVYRYNPPHDRSHLLRSEFVVKGEDARLLVDTILRDGIDATAAGLGRSLGWQHPSWDAAGTSAAELTSWRPERRKGKTAFWLADTVAPLIAKMHNDGHIDVYQWLTDHVIPRIITSSPE